MPRAQINIALYLTVNDISGGGGAERFFGRFYDLYVNQQFPQQKLLLMLKQKSLSNLHANSVIESNKGHQYIVLRNISNRFKHIIEGIDFLLKIKIHKIDVIHVASYGKQDLNHLKWLQYLPKAIRPKLIVNIVNALIPFTYKSNKYGDYDKYSPLFNDIKIDGIYSWYDTFRRFAIQEKLFANNPDIGVINTRYVDTKTFKPEVKNREFIWAARMVEIKQPVKFVKAIKRVKEHFGEEIKNWKFSMYGDGPELENVIKEVKRNGLNDIVLLKKSPDMRVPFSKSLCFVSTAVYGNFPSLSMAEAMASGNAIIALDFEQTDYYIKQGWNGIIYKDNEPAAIANAIIKVMSDKNKLVEMGKNSRELMLTEHTSEKFIEGIDKFWNSVIKK